MPAGERARVVRLITRLNIGGPAQQALLLTRDLAARWPTVLAAGQACAGRRASSHASSLRGPQLGCWQRACSRRCTSGAATANG